ncbi:hypothetical protein [Aeromonas media]|uniref:hypothetical protein n=1 Tax=Aeromonas media TaxID=651 RepID=UPI00191CB295|nr:hypothetical protein [Aeromonas media]MBL0511286.1 hypothetical protein [Aeromonas media]
MTELKYSEFTYDSIDSIEIHDVSAIYHINIDGYYLSLFFNPKITSEKLYVLSPGYLERKKFQHPYFQRMSWLDSINASGIIITDPTLSIHHDIGIAWFQGTKSKFAIPLIVKVIEKFRNHLKVIRKKVLFYGSSAGGFASLMMSCLMKGSCCVVNNPQTNVLNFRENIATKMIERCYPDTTNNEIHNFYILRLSAERYFIANENIPKCLYVQNISDVEHYNNHFIPFISGLGQQFTKKNIRDAFDNIIVKLYKSESSGHNPAVYEFMEPYFKLAEHEFFK